MIYVGLTKGIINATAHWYLAVTEDGTTFKNEDKDTLKEVLKCVEEMQKDTLKEVAICFDHWGASSWIAEIAEFVSKHEHLHFPYVNLKAAAGNKKPYYVLLEDMIEPISLTVIEGKGK